MWLFSVVGKEKKYSYLEFKELNRLLKVLCKDLHNHTSFKNVTVSIAEKRGRKATHLKIAYQHVSDIYKQEQRELDAEEKRLVGAIWESRSGGKCLFVMPKGNDLEAIKSKIKTKPLPPKE